MKFAINCTTERGYYFEDYSTTTALKSSIGNIVTLAGLKVRIIRTHDGRKFKGSYRRSWPSFSSRTKTPRRVPPNVLARRSEDWVFLNKKRVNVMVGEIKAPGRSSKLCAKTTSIACCMSRVCARTAGEGNISLYEILHGTASRTEGLGNFATTKFLKTLMRQHGMGCGTSCLNWGKTT